MVIHEIAADVVRLRRAPDIPQSHRAPVTFEWPPRFPRLPPILLDRLAVGRVILDKELAGQAAIISLSGRLAESGQGAAALTLAFVIFLMVKTINQLHKLGKKDEEPQEEEDPAPTSEELLTEIRDLLKEQQK